ncbi:hypothetical protein [Exiguobacterium sp. s78]|uniref:hypothetical protein n=1 Tax=Exiguobacterium sp. s78 TaxID=2751197 RepID=UPI001BEBAAFC|nr:hypothetical protein [Exiguobacterium sp. s78]
MNWKDLRIDRVGMIQKCVAEFDVNALDFFEEMYEGDTIHYGSFKVKIYETSYNNDEAPGEAGFTGYTNLKLIDSEGYPEGATGYALTIEETLEKTVSNFLDLVEEFKEEKPKGLQKEDFIIVPYDEF